MSASLKHNPHAPKGRRLWTMPGGVHPPDNKEQSANSPIRSTALSERLIIPLQQHQGEPAQPLVQVGDQVLKGQCIGNATGAISVPVHASSSGVVESISLQPVPHPSQLDALCIVIRTDGEDRWIARQPLQDFRSHSKQQVLDHLRNAGIAGLGGAAFPTAAKLAVADGRPVEQLILNAAECEPYITADDRLLQERADQVIEGLLILSWLLEPTEILIGIEDNKPRAAEALRQACTQANAQHNIKLELVVVPARYPSGGEKQLIQILTGKEVPSGGLPIDVGVICQNVGTAYAIKRAVIDGEPLISRITTVTGAAVKQPGNYEVLLGTPVMELLQQADVEQHTLHRLVMGGPMMGFTLEQPAVPVTKITNCVLAATAQEWPDPAPEQACIRCGDCADVCPASLLPQQLYWFAKAGDLERTASYNLFDCIECGACAYVCPSAIPLVQYYRFAKGEIRQQQAERRQANRARERFEARNDRIEREQLEKEEKRQKRANAAANHQTQVRETLAQNVNATPGIAAPITTVVTPPAATTDPAPSANINTDIVAPAQIVPATNPSAPATASATISPAVTSPVQTSPVPVASTLAQLQTTAASTLKRYKEAQKALEVAEKKGADNLPALRARVEQLKDKADVARDTFQAAKAAQDATPPADATP